MPEKQLKILIVDDEKIIRDFFKRLLSLLNVEAMDAEDGYKAVELAKTISFDAFFVDVRMPGMNGLETYRKIREIKPDAIVIMMTGYAVEDLLEKAKTEGAYEIVHKPFEITQIKDIVDKISKENVRMLVIDDDMVILDFFSNLLKLKGINYDVAKNKEEALALLRKEKFDLIFLDLVLGDVNGIDLYKEIKEMLPGAAIELITGYPQKMKEAGSKLDIQGYLYKPFDVDSVIKCIEKIKQKAR